MSGRDSDLTWPHSSSADSIYSESMKLDCYRKVVSEEMSIQGEPALLCLPPSCAICSGLHGLYLYCSALEWCEPGQEGVNQVRRV